MAAVLISAGAWAKSDCTLSFPQSLDTVPLRMLVEERGPLREIVSYFLNAPSQNLSRKDLATLEDLLLHPAFHFEFRVGIPQSSSEAVQARNNFIRTSQIFAERLARIEALSRERAPVAIGRQEKWYGAVADFYLGDWLGGAFREEALSHIEPYQARLLIEKGLSTKELEDLADRAEAMAPEGSLQEEHASQVEEPMNELSRDLPGEQVRQSSEWVANYKATRWDHKKIATSHILYLHLEAVFNEEISPESPQWEPSMPYLEALRDVTINYEEGLDYLRGHWGPDFARDFIPLAKVYLTYFAGLRMYLNLLQLTSGNHSQADIHIARIVSKLKKIQYPLSSAVWKLGDSKNPLVREITSLYQLAGIQFP